MGVIDRDPNSGSRASEPRSRPGRLLGWSVGQLQAKSLGGILRQGIQSPKLAAKVGKAKTGKPISAAIAQPHRPPRVPPPL